MNRAKTHLVDRVPGPAGRVELLHDGVTRVDAMLQQHALYRVRRGVGRDVSVVIAVDDPNADRVGEVSAYQKKRKKRPNAVHVMMRMRRHCMSQFEP